MERILKLILIVPLAKQDHKLVIYRTIRFNLAYKILCKNPNK